MKNQALRADIFYQLATKIKAYTKRFIASIKDYFKRLLFPIYLFPIKLVTYSIYYLVKFLIKFIFALISLVFETIIFPFKSFKNLLKSVFVLGIFLYLLASFLVIADYLKNQYGQFGKFFCSYEAKSKLQNSVVRIVGGYSEGSGFFISPNQVLTNFHVIADEPSPKIIFPDGSFVTPDKILGNRDADMAVLITSKDYLGVVLPLPDKVDLREDEPLISTGYAMGTDLVGRATAVKGNFVDFRKSKKYSVGYLQTNISLVEGMSGGPLADQCGNVVGINTMGLAGLSMFIAADQAKIMVPNFTDQGIKKIAVDPSASPEEAVKAFYTYLKARRMEDGFKLLSQKYLEKTNFEEWTSRFKDILDVNIFLYRRHGTTKDTAFVKFGTKNWVDGEVEFHYYEGTWKTVKEDGAYKMLKSMILEVENPSWDWFYE